MVQFTPVVLAALLAAPSLAAPVISHEHHEHDLEAREPRIGAVLSKIKKVVTGSRLSAAGSVAVAAGTVASTQQQPSARDLEELDARGRLQVMGGRKGLPMGPREIDEINELIAREPRIGAALSKIRKVVTGSRLSAAGSVAVAAGTIASTQQQPAARELEELDARDPRIGAALKSVRKVVNSGSVSTAAGVVGAAATIHAATKQPAAREFDEELSERELEELEELAARDPLVRNLVKKVVRGAMGVAGGLVSMPPLGRDLENIEELDARDPLVRNLVKKVVRGAMGVAGGLVSMPPLGRDLENVEELSARDPRIGAALRGIRKVVNSGSISAAAEVAGTAATIHAATKQPAAREFDEELEELAARDPLVRNLVKKVVRGAMGVAGGLVSMPPLGRDLENIEELDARDPRIGAALRGIRKVVNSGSISAAAEVAGTAATIHAATRQPAAREFIEELSERELEELEELAARDPLVRNLVKKVVRGAMGVAGGLVSMPPLGRDLENVEELDARDPLVRNLVKKVVRGAMGVAGGLVSMPPLGRDLENVEQLAAREYYEELD